MKKKIIALITIFVVLVALFFVGTGFQKRTDVILVDYSVSEDGTQITLDVGIPTSIGYIRGFKDNGGGVKPHYLTFYSTFGGINSPIGAKHKSIDESLDVIRNVFKGEECYAICEKNSEKAIGAIELMLNGHTDMTERDDECELGYWLGKPFWGRGYMPEAAREIIRHGFEDIGMNTIWCGYYEGNQKSKRVQEKVGFIYHHTCENVPVPLMNETRIGHTNVLTKAHWKEICEHERGQK